MIHWTPEGQELKTGLNFYCTELSKRNITKKLGFWFRVVFFNKREIFYFRFRSYLAPHFIFEYLTQNILDEELPPVKYQKRKSKRYNICGDYAFKVKQTGWTRVGR